MNKLCTIYYYSYFFQVDSKIGDDYCNKINQGIDSTFFWSTTGPILSRHGTFLYKQFAFQHFIMAIG